MTDWDRIVREQGPRVFAIAWRILGNAADAEDVTQDVFLQLHRMQCAGTVRHAAALLRRIATCRALDRLRVRKTPVPLDGLLLAANGCGPHEELVGRELADRLRLAIATLPPREAEVFCLRHFEEHSYQHIAESLGISVGATAVALHKARAKLEALLDETLPEDDHAALPEQPGPAPALGRAER